MATRGGCPVHLNNNNNALNANNDNYNGQFRE